MNKNKILPVVLVLAATVLGILTGLLWSSVDNVNNIQKNYRELEFKKDEIEFAGCDEVDGVLVSTEPNAYIQLNNIKTYVNNIFISGGLTQGGKTEVSFLCSDNSGNFGTDKPVSAKVSKVSGKVYLNIDGEVKKLRVYLNDPDLYSTKSGNSDMIISTVNGVTVNPRVLNISATKIFSAFSFFFVIALLLILLLCYKKRFAEAKSVFDRYRYLLINLLQRDIKVKYRRSVLGILWSVLNPFLMMLVLTAVFSKVMRVQMEVPFAAFYLTGSLIFNFVSEATNTSLSSIVGAASLMKKVYIPKYIFPLEKCMFSLVNMMFSMIAVVIVFIFLRVTPMWTMLLFPIPIVYTFVFALGMSLFVAAANVFFRDVGHLYSVWITAWMYLTPVIYPIDILPEIMKPVIKCNPMYYYVEYFRDVLLYGKLPSLEQNLICIGFSAVFLAVGLYTFKKSQDKFILHI